MSHDFPWLEDTYRTVCNVSEDFGLDPWRSDHPATSGDIVDEVLESISLAEFVVADLSLERPSVYYEIGYAHAVPIAPEQIVLIAQEGTRVHFDLHTHRVIFYANQAKLADGLGARLKENRGA